MQDGKEYCEQQLSRDGFRQLLKDTYIEGMSFALEALKAGITLNGIDI